MNYVFLLFPGQQLHRRGRPDKVIQVARLAGLGFASLNICLFMMARYGLRGIFMAGRPGRYALFILFSGLILMGGFRTSIVIYLMVFAILFFMERLYQTRLLMVFCIFGAVLRRP